MKKEKNIPDFKTPKGYFETFEERLFSKIAEEKFPKSRGFKVPKNYFDKFEESVIGKLNVSEKPTKVIPLFSRKYFGYAAAIAACLLIGFNIFNQKTDNSNLDALQLAAIDTYIEEGNLNLDLYEVTSFIDDEDIANLDFDTQQFTDAALEDYLLENLDTEIITNEK
ncbi:hypothetical protein [Aequorivita lipolytica]|uniref:Uncharacterized protein n=1 Tax=Aequorivita lipolytica TaxID=153267 RepID=A0A5C6YLX0_9FLAO|nr:hypothetical protein [Aequorivita lipolytica]TXD68236.1 hypothetical protein ESV24_13190 [Aequorivita lipolytica]SRX53486.1 hypothetical protein AEQU2_02718 [Aequorivita lipolytica]